MPYSPDIFHFLHACTGSTATGLSQSQIVTSVLSELVWQDSHSLWSVTLLLVTMSLAVLVFYAPQWKQLRIRYRFVLVGLRLMGLLALVLSLLQPMITRQPKAAPKGVVVVAVDHSYSMDVHDRQRKAPQWVALADGMGRLPDGLRLRPVKITVAAEGIRDRLDEVDTAQSEMDYATVSGRSTVEAARHWLSAYSELTKSIDVLAANTADLDRKIHLATALANLQKMTHNADDNRAGDKKVADIRNAISDLNLAVTEFQNTFDQSLYTGNAQVKSVCDELSKLSRLQLVEQAIVHTGSGLLYRLPKNWQVFGYSLGDPIEPIPLQFNGQPVRRLLVDADANWQDPFADIRAVLDSLRGVPVDAVVYFSDGHAIPANAAWGSNGGKQGANSNSAGSRSVPMTPGMAGSANGPANGWRSYVGASNPAGLNSPAKNSGAISVNHSPVSAAGKHVALNVPVIAVSAAASSKINSPDWSLSQLVVPNSVFAGETFSVHARLRGVGFKSGASIEVTCDVDPADSDLVNSNADLAKSTAASMPGLPSTKPSVKSESRSKTVQTKRATLRNDLSAEVEFQVAVPQAGSHHIVLQVPAGANELSRENNVVGRWIKVIDQKQKIAVIADSASWDFRVLRNVAMDQPGIELSTQILDGNVCVMSADQLRQQDCVVLFDVPASAMDSLQWAAIDSVASRKGGMILLVAGNDHLPFEYNNTPMREWLPYWTDAPAIATTTGTYAVKNPSTSGPTTQTAVPLNTMPSNATPSNMNLPIAASPDEAARFQWRTWKGQDASFRLQPVNLTQNNLHLTNLAHPQFPSVEQRAWDSLTGVFRYLPLTSLKPNVRAILVEKESQDAVVTEMSLGNGRIVFLGTDELWRLRSRSVVGKNNAPMGTDYIGTAGEMIMKQLLNGFIEPAYAISKNGIALDLANGGIAPGEAVEIRCKLTDVKTFWPISLQGVDVAVKRNGEVIRRQSLSADVANPGRCFGSIMGLEAGDYAIEASAEGRSVEYPLHVVRHYNVEMEDPSGNLSTLQNLAEASGGRVLTLEQMRDLPTVLASISHEPKTVTVRLWDSAYLLVFVVSCFIVEWALRKRLGLA